MVMLGKSVEIMTHPMLGCNACMTMLYVLIVLCKRDDARFKHGQTVYSNFQAVKSYLAVRMTRFVSAVKGRESFDRTNNPPSVSNANE